MRTGRPDAVVIRVLGLPPGDPAGLCRVGAMGETAFYLFLSGRDNLVAAARRCRVPDARVETVLDGAAWTVSRPGLRLQPGDETAAGGIAAPSNWSSRPGRTQRPGQSAPGWRCNWERSASGHGGTDDPARAPPDVEKTSLRQRDITWRAARCCFVDPEYLGGRPGRRPGCSTAQAAVGWPAGEGPVSVWVGPVRARPGRAAAVNRQLVEAAWAVSEVRTRRRPLREVFWSDRRPQRRRRLAALARGQAQAPRAARAGPGAVPVFAPLRAELLVLRKSRWPGRWCWSRCC